MQLKTDKNSPHTPRKNSTWKENTQILFKIHDWQHDVEEINQSNICRKWFIEKDQWKKWDKPTALVQAFGSDVCRPFWLLRWSSILSLEKAFFSLFLSLSLSVAIVLESLAAGPCSPASSRSSSPNHSPTTAATFEKRLTSREYCCCYCCFVHESHSQPRTCTTLNIHRILGNALC